MANQIVMVNGEELILDSKDLEVSEVNLNNFLSTFASKYNHYSNKFTLLQRVVNHYEDSYEVAYAKKFEMYKNDGSSDKLAEARAKSNDEVVEAKKKVRESKYKKDQVWSFLRSMDKAHENALNLGYNVRKELDKLHSNINKPLVFKKSSLDDME